MFVYFGVRGSRVKGFKFKLQSVLNAREKEFENRRLDFAKAKNKLHQEHLTMQKLVNILQETISSLEEVLKSGGIDQTIIFVHQNYMTTTKINIEYQKLAIKKAEEELEEKNQLMLEALKAQKVMEKLREKALNEFTANLNRHEMILIDEIATCRYKKAN